MNLLKLCATAASFHLPALEASFCFEYGMTSVVPGLTIWCSISFAAGECAEGSRRDRRPPVPP